MQLLLEFEAEVIVDWLWEETQLPKLKACVGLSEESEWVREGCDGRGARSRHAVVVLPARRVGSMSDRDRKLGQCLSLLGGAGVAP